MIPLLLGSFDRYQVPLSPAEMRYIEAYRAVLESPSRPPDSLSGYGLVYCLDEPNTRAHVGAVVALRMAREAGWNGIIQLWHGGAIPNVSGLDVQLRQFGQQPGNWHGWAAKGYALRYSGLERALFLDWDAYLVSDPAAVFADLERFGMIYWCGTGPTAHGGWRYNPAIFAQFVSDPKRIAGAVQGGVMGFNCRLWWKALECQSHYNDHSDWWWPRNRSSDEEGWRLSLSTLDVPTKQGQLSWQGPAWINSYAGEAIAVHRCSAKLWSNCAPRWDQVLPKEKRVQEHFRSLAGDGYRNAVFAPCPQYRSNNRWRIEAKRRQKRQLQRR